MLTPKATALQRVRAHARPARDPTEPGCHGTKRQPSSRLLSSSGLLKSPLGEVRPPQLGRKLANGMHPAVSVSALTVLDREKCLSETRSDRTGFPIVNRE